MTIQKIRKLSYLDNSEISDLKEENEILTKEILSMRGIVNRFNDNFNFAKEDWKENSNLKIEKILENFDKNIEIEREDDKKIVFSAGMLFTVSFLTFCSTFYLKESGANISGVILLCVATLSIVTTLFSFFYFIENAGNLFEKLIGKKAYFEVLTENEKYAQRGWFRKMFTRKLKNVNSVSFGLSNIEFQNEMLKKFWIRSIDTDYSKYLNLKLKKGSNNKYEINKEIVEKRLLDFLKK